MVTNPLGPNRFSLLRQNLPDNDVLKLFIGFWDSMPLNTTSLDTTSPTRTSSLFCFLTKCFTWKVLYEQKIGILWILVFEKEKKNSRSALTWSSLTNTKARICKHV